MTRILELRGASRIHGEGPRAVRALADADLSLRAGEFAAVMGPSGSGKSTLLHLAGGLDLATSGVVLVEGTDLASLGAAKRALLRRRTVGYVFQDFNLLPALTAGQNVAFTLELDGTPWREAAVQARSALGAVGVAELFDRRPDEISGGQAQRVAIARAIVGSRRLLLADEPTGALDSATGLEVMRMLRAQADQGAAVLLVTHEPRFAAWADRTVFLRDGRIVDTTGPSDPDAYLQQVGSGR